MPGSINTHVRIITGVAVVMGLATLMFRGPTPKRKKKVKFCQHYGCLAKVSVDDNTETGNDFCSAHVKAAASIGQTFRSDPLEIVETCQHDGCNQKVCVDENTQMVHDFCSRRHAMEATAIAKRGDSYKVVYPDYGTAEIVNMKYYAFPPRPMNETRQLYPALSMLKEDHPVYDPIEGQFLCKWKKDANDLRVERIFKIEVATWLHDDHVKYATGKTTMHRRFHGTSCSSECNFFYDLQGGPCQMNDCNICGICIQGFRLEGNVGRTAKAGDFLPRYGDGLYFSSVSGKANDYAVHSEKIWQGRKWRCMFTATVAVGQPYVTEAGELPGNLCPPAGCDSVVALPGNNLIHDEIVVYNEAAAIPTYLIVYSTGDMIR